MVELHDQRLDDVFHALAHPTRRAIVRRLEKGSCSVNDIADQFPYSLAAISKHLHVLERASLVRRTWHGTTAECRLDASAMQTAEEWLAHYRAYWSESLDRLATLVESPKPRKRR